MRIALCLILLAAPRQWAYVHTADLLDRATIVAAGEIRSIKDDGKRPVARMKIVHLLKGKPGGDEIDLPFKMTANWGCDFTIRYEIGRKYLLLLDEKHDYRVVYYPSRTHDVIQSYDGPEVSFARLSLDVMGGVDLDRRIPEVIKLTKTPQVRVEALQVFRWVPRAAIRPYLAEVRAAYGPSKVSYPRTSPDWASWCKRGLAVELQVTRDLSLISEVVGVEPFDEPALLRTLSLLTGWTVVDLESFKKSWAVALRRAETLGNPDEVAGPLNGLGSAEGAERDRAFQRILDLGPDVLNAVKSNLGAKDPEVKARVAELVRELELLDDLRADLAARRR
jgi:hypothetical protein